MRLTTPLCSPPHAHKSHSSSGTVHIDRQIVGLLLLRSFQKVGLNGASIHSSDMYRRPVQFSRKFAGRIANQTEPAPSSPRISSYQMLESTWFGRSSIFTTYVLPVKAILQLNPNFYICTIASSVTPSPFRWHHLAISQRSPQILSR